MFKVGDIVNISTRGYNWNRHEGDKYGDIHTVHTRDLTLDISEMRNLNINKLLDVCHSK